MGRAEVVLGTYGGDLVGLALEQASSGLTFNTLFAYTPHASSIRALAAASFGREHLLFSGSSDESIRSYSLRTRKELGVLDAHEGSINCLAAAGGDPASGARQALWSGAEDERLGWWVPVDQVVGRKRAREPWSLRKRLKGHRAPITDVCTHPLGVLAMTVANDGYLKLWDGVKGRAAHSFKLKENGKSVAFSPGQATQYLVGGNAQLTLNSLDDDEEESMRAWEMPRALLTATFCSDTLAATATDDQLIRVWDSRSADPNCQFEMDAHESRVRHLIALDRCPRVGHDFALISVDTSGSVLVWDLRNHSNPLLRTDIETGSRVTAAAGCVTGVS